MKKTLIGSGLLGATTHAMAHEGHGAGALLTAFTHPMTGLDHLVVFLALGFFIAQRKQYRVSQLLGLALLMGIGIILGQLGLYAPMVETMIACSLIVLGVICFKRWLPNSAALFALLGGSVMLHGLAHGVLLQSLPMSQALATSAMMMSGAVVITLLGFAIANSRLVKRFALQQWLAAAMVLVGGSLVLAG